MSCCSGGGGNNHGSGDDGSSTNVHDDLAGKICDPRNSDATKLFRFEQGKGPKKINIANFKEACGVNEFCDDCGEDLSSIVKDMDSHLVEPDSEEEYDEIWNDPIEDNLALFLCWGREVATTWNAPCVPARYPPVPV